MYIEIYSKYIYLRVFKKWGFTTEYRVYTEICIIANLYICAYSRSGVLQQSIVCIQKYV